MTGICRRCDKAILEGEKEYIGIDGVFCSRLCRTNFMRYEYGRFIRGLPIKRKPVHRGIICHKCGKVVKRLYSLGMVAVGSNVPDRRWLCVNCDDDE